MAFFSINTRELRSFRLLKRTKNFAEHLMTDEGSTLYLMCDSLHPHERIEMRERFVAEHGLDLVFLPKNVSQNLLRGPEWIEFRNLFKGQVVEVSSKSGEALTENQLRFVSNYNKFSLRFLLWRRQIYRAQRLKRSFEASANVVNSTVVAAQLMQKTKVLTMLPLLMGHGNAR